MTLAVTSFTPATGPCTGGTRVVITGTGLTAVTAVMVGDHQGTIDTTATNTATSLTFLTPAISNDLAAAMKITVLDSVTPTEAQSSGNYTYTAVTTPVLVSATASKFILKVDSSVAQDGSSFIPVRGMVDFKPSVATTTQDDSDYDSGVWGSDAKTQLKWSNVCKLSRKRATGYVEDPGQKVLRLAHDQVGAAGTVLVQWYDRNGHGSEAYQGSALVQWDDDGGATSALSTVSVTLMGQGVRTPIVNPAGA
jgi:hypothetical protein